MYLFFRGWYNFFRFFKIKILSFNYTWEAPVIHVQNKADISLASVEDKSSSDIRDEIDEDDIVGSGKTFSVKPNKTEFSDNIGKFLYITFISFSLSRICSKSK